MLPQEEQNNIGLSRTFTTRIATTRSSDPAGPHNQAAMLEGERIRRIRESLGLSQKYVALEAGLPCSTLSRIEKGKMVLTYRRAVRLARVLMCDLGAFDEGLGGPLRAVVGGLFAPPAANDAPSASSPSVA